MQPDALDNSVNPHNAYVNDGVTPYIEWAVGNDFGVIDINFPQHHAGAELDETKPIDLDELHEQTRDLLCYVWDNYLEINPAAHVSILSVGDSYTGVKQLLSSRSMPLPLLSHLIKTD